MDKRREVWRLCSEAHQGEDQQQNRGGVRRDRRRGGRHLRQESRVANVHDQSPEFKFRFVFFTLQMLRFSALCGPNEQKFGELLT